MKRLDRDIPLCGRNFETGPEQIRGGHASRNFRPFAAVPWSI
jgi:hypothetical protein